MKYTVNNFSEFTDEDLAQGIILKKDGDEIKFLYKEVIYTIKQIGYDAETKTRQLKINGYNISVKHESPLDLLINQMGFNQPPKKEIKEVLAPMPGLVKEIYIQEGQEIKEGDNLFILEAMKMENIIKASGDGIITSVKVKVGDKVEKGNLLAKL